MMENIPEQISDLLTIDPATTDLNHAENEDNLAALDEEKIIKQAPRVIDAQNAFLITEAMNSVIWGADWNIKPFWQGTGFRARKLKRRDIAGKTGTTNQSKDAWFSGFSRRLVTTSWIGFDDHSRNLGRSAYNNNLGKNQIVGTEFGAKSAQPAWILFMAQALKELEVEPFEPPENIVSVRIDKATGKLTTKTDRSSQFEYFKVGTEPTEYVTQDNSGDILDGDIFNETNNKVKKEEPEEEDIF
jgi:penicillin-binding protein 1A